MKRSHEPVFWSLFGAGGVLSALVAPALILITGVLAPIGLWMPQQALAYERVLGFAQHGVHAGTGAMAAAYGGALAGTLATAAMLFMIGF